MFKDNLKRAIAAKGYVVKEAASLANVSKRTVDNWLAVKPTTPAADDAVRIAVALDTTVEELIDGEQGRAYILEWAGQRGGKWEPPSRLKPLLELVVSLPEDELEKVLAVVKIYMPKSAGSQPKSEAL